MSEEKKQELAPEDLESVDGGVILHRKKLDDAIAEGTGKTELEGHRIAELEGHRMAQL